MRLINLNTWGGRKFDELSRYIQDTAPHADIFCFQEILDSHGVEGADSSNRVTLMDDIRSMLPDFDGYFNEMFSAKSLSKGEAGDVSFGNAIFVREGIRVVSHDSSYISGEKQEYNGLPQKSALAQQTILRSGDATLAVYNVHGIPFWPKFDSPDRDEQIRNLMNVMRTNGHPKIVCGDFNMLPNTKGIAAIGTALRNLGNEYGVSVTRSAFHFETYGRAPEVDRISDYMFASPEITVRNLSVPDLLISDHLPMELDFEVAGTDL